MSGAVRPSGGQIWSITQASLVLLGSGVTRSSFERRSRVAVGLGAVALVWCRSSNFRRVSSTQARERGMDSQVATARLVRAFLSRFAVSVVSPS